MTQQPQAGPDSPSGPTKLLALVTAALGIVVYLIGFFGDLVIAALLMALLVGGGLLVGACVLPKTGRGLVPGAIAITTGTLLLLQFVADGNAPTSAIIALIVAFLQTVSAIGAVLLDAGIVTAPAPRPAAPPGYGPVSGGYPPGYGQPGGYGQPMHPQGYGQPAGSGQSTPGTPGLPAYSAGQSGPQPGYGAGQPGYGAGQSGPQPAYGTGQPGYGTGQSGPPPGYGQAGGYAASGAGTSGVGAHGEQGSGAHGAQPAGYEPQQAPQSWGQQPAAPSASASQATNLWHGDTSTGTEAEAGPGAPAAPTPPRTAVYRPGDAPGESPDEPSGAPGDPDSAEVPDGDVTRSIRPGELRPPG